MVGNEKRIQRLPEIALASQADEFLLDFTVMEENNGGDGANAEACRQRLAGIGVDLTDLDFADVFGG